MRAPLVTATFLFATTFASAADGPPPWAKPLAQLPKHVLAADGQLTLVADFAHTKPGERVPVYLVNRTAASLTLGAQDGDVYLKQEYESAPGTWTRAQSHRYSWCGNSYGSRTLEVGEFAVIPGFAPKAGAKAKVRYRFYDQVAVAVASNTAEALIDEKEVQQAADDSMALRTGNFEYIEKVLLGKAKPNEDRRQEALWHMVNGRYDHDKVGDQLEVLTKDADVRLAGDAKGLLVHHRKKKGDPKN